MSVYQSRSALFTEANTTAADKKAVISFYSFMNFISQSIVLQCLTLYIYNELLINVLDKVSHISN